MEAGMLSNSESARDSRARRAARRVGLVAKKSRWRTGSIDNYGEFMLIVPATNFAIAGFRFDRSAEEVLDYCKD
jgi:hypothetical protein